MAACSPTTAFINARPCSVLSLHSSFTVVYSAADCTLRLKAALICHICLRTSVRCACRLALASLTLLLWCCQYLPTHYLVLCSVHFIFIHEHVSGPPRACFSDVLVFHTPRWLGSPWALPATAAAAAGQRRYLRPLARPLICSACCRRVLYLLLAHLCHAHTLYFLFSPLPVGAPGPASSLSYVIADGLYRPYTV